jgi:hypothetical protein
MSVNLLEEQYVEKAKRAYNDQNLKLCLIYLKKISNWRNEFTSLLVDSAYRLWKSNLEQENQENETLELVQQSFAQLMSGAIPYELIQGFDYIRLSHIYLVEGNLRGSLEILNMASNRGLLEDVLIVAQTWTIIKRLEGMKQREINDRINFLVSSVTLLAASTRATRLDSIIYIYDSPLPLSYLYLHCTNHVYHITKLRPKTLKQKDQRFQQFKSMLIEAYYLHYGTKELNYDTLLAWFLDPFLWNEMGKQLETTPFLLLVEDCYWEAFTRRPLIDIDLEEIMRLMKKYNRKDKIPFLLREALLFNQWNTFARNELVKLEKELQPDASLREWTILFESENKELISIQARYRGYRLRKHWPEKSKYYINLRKDFLEKMELSYTYYGYAVQRYHLCLINKWKDFLVEWKDLKRQSATRIQKHFRRFRQRKRYARKLYRVHCANSKYLYLFALKNIWKKTHSLHHWYQVWLDAKRRSATVIITNVLFLNGYNQLLVKGMNLLTTLIRIHKKHTQKQMIRYWFGRYLIRRKKHARVTIRFFIRSILRQIEDRKVEAQLAHIEEVIKQKLDVNFQRNQIYILKPFWMNWKKCFTARIRYKKLSNAVSTLQRLFLLKKAQRKFHFMKIRLVNQKAWIKYYQHKILLSGIKRWYYNGAAFRITRFLHGAVAHKKFKRLFEIHRVVRRRAHFYKLNKYEYILKKWKKYLYLTKRIKLRAIKRLQKFYRFVQFKKLLSKKIRRKAFYYRLIWTYFYDKLLQRWFNYFYYCTIRRRQEQAISILNRVYLKFAFQNNMGKLVFQCEQQSKLKKLVEILYERKWNRQFWKNCSHSVKVNRFISFLTSKEERKQEIHQIEEEGGDEDLSPNDHNSHQKIDIQTNELVPWEVPVPAKKILSSLSLLSLYKVFSIWMIQFRLRKRVIRYQSFLTSFDVYDNLIYRLKKRKQFIITLQSFLRIFRCKKILQLKKEFYYRNLELIAKHEKIIEKNYFKKMTELCALRRKSRLIIQCGYRVYTSKLDYEEYLKKKEFYDECTDYLNSSLFYKKTLMKKVFRHMMSVYLKLFIGSIYDDNFVVHKEKLKKRNGGMQQKFSQNKGKIATGKQKKKKKIVKKKTTLYEDNPNEEESSSSEDEEEHDDNRQRTEEDEEELDNFDDDEGEDDSAMARLNLIQQYQQKLQQKQQNKLSGNTFPKSLSSSSISVPSPYGAVSGSSNVSVSSSSHHLAQIKELKKKKQQQKANLFEISRKKQLLNEKFTHHQSNKSPSFHPSQSLLYFQSQAFHSLFYQLKEKKFLPIDDLSVQGLYLQEIYYLLQQTNVVVLSNISKKQLSLISEAFNGKKVILLNSYLKEKYFVKYLLDLFGKDRNFYEKTLFEKNRWPLTLPHHCLEDEEEEQLQIIANKKKIRSNPKTEGQFLEEELVLPKYRLVQLELNQVTMSIYTIMRFCRLIVRLKENRYGLPSAGGISLQSSLVDDVGTTSTSTSSLQQGQGFMITELKSPSTADHQHSYQDTVNEFQQMRKIYQKVVYFGVESLSVDVPSLGLLGFLMLVHSLQVTIYRIRKVILFSH